MKTFYTIVLLLLCGALQQLTAQKIEFKVGGVKMGHVDDTRLAFQLGNGNLFIGEGAGDILAGLGNTAVGVAAGNALNGGDFNLIMGRSTGFKLAGGNENTFLGTLSGYNNISGSGNVFVGYRAGFSETGSDKLYIANASAGDPLIYGEFPNQLLRINAPAEVFGDIKLDEASPRIDFYNGISQLGYIASVSTNFIVANELSGNLYFRNNGSVRMAIDGAGEVGIGTTAPAQMLHVTGKIQIGDDGAAATEGAIRYDSGSNLFEGYDGSSWNAFGGGHWTKTASDIYYNAGNVGVGTTAPQEDLHVLGSIRLDHSQPTFRFYQGATFAAYFQHNANDFSISNRLAGKMSFLTNSGTRMTIDANGLVGIGTGTPTQKLHISGKLKLSDDGNTPTAGVLRYNSVDSVFEGHDGDAWTSLSGGGGHWTKVGNELNYMDGNVGILYADPAYDLHVGGELAIDGFAPTIYFRNNPTAYGYISSIAGGMTFNNLTANKTKFDIDGDTRMVITNTGRVGIGTDDPDNMLHVIGDAHLEDASPRLGLYQPGEADPYVGYLVQIGDAMSLVNREAGSMFLKTNDVERLTIESGGDVGIGTTNPIEKLHVEGRIRADHATEPRLDLYLGSTNVARLSYVGDDVKLMNAYNQGGIDFIINGTERMAILQSGEVGIGGTSTSRKLNVEGSEQYGIYATNSYAGSNSKYAIRGENTSSGSGRKYGVYGRSVASSSNPDNTYGVYGSASGYDSGTQQNSSANLYAVYGVVTTNGTGNKYALYGNATTAVENSWALYAQGRAYFSSDVRIGYTADVPGYLLAVDGKIITEELKVELSGTWPDYVFHKDYDLLPIGQLEQAIRTTGHLPGVPSSKEVEEGFHVGEMNRILLEKVEELTLYIIQQQKEIEDLRQQLNAMNK